MCKIYLSAVLQNHTTQIADQAKQFYVHLFFNLFWANLPLQALHVHSSSVASSYAFSNLLTESQWENRRVSIILKDIENQKVRHHSEGSAGKCWVYTDQS